jgi:hypothetical protein
VASKRIDININSTNAGSGFKSAGTEISKLKTEASGAGSTIGQSLSKGASNASSSIGKLGTTASKTFGTIKAGASAASKSFGDLGNAIASVASGLGAMEVAQAMWTGATTKEFNKAYLQTKMSSQAADQYISQIQRIVAEVPGDDTFMNNLMSGAVAKNTKISTKMLEDMGRASADYLATSTAMGKTQMETQNDLKEYLLTGNTTQLERDSILKGQLTTLEGQATVEDRIKALQKALNAEGYAGLSNLGTTAQKWEEIKGKMQLAATTIGEKILPPISDALSYLLQLDEKTNGWSTILIVAVGTLGLVALALAPIVTATASAATAMAAYRKDAEKAALANAANKGPGMPTGGAGGRDWSKYGAGAALAGKTLAGVAGGLIAGDFLAEIFKGPMEALTGQKAFKAYGGVSNLLGMGTEVSGESYNEKTIENAKKYGATVHDNKKAWDDFVNSVKSGASGMSSAFMTNVEMFKTTWSGWINGAKTKIGELGASWNAGWAWIRGAALNTIGAVVDAWNWMKGIVGSWINTGISVATGAIDWARDRWNDLKNFVMNNPIVGTIRQAIGMGPAGPGISGARGPGIGLHYENYAGHKKNAWNASGTGLSGNCVDMTLGLMSRYGGSMVNGTWNGGAHVWWRSPSGKEMDPARKALEGTMTPPARGPGGGNFGNIIIQGDVYGFNDFKAKVEQANAGIGFDAGRF